MLQINSTSDTVDPNNIASIYADARVILAHNGGVPPDDGVNRRVTIKTWMLVYQESAPNSIAEGTSSESIYNIASRGSANVDFVLEALEIAREGSRLEHDLEWLITEQFGRLQNYFVFTKERRFSSKYVALVLRKIAETDAPFEHLISLSHAHDCPQRIKEALLEKASQIATTYEQHMDLAKTYAPGPERDLQLWYALPLSTALKEIIAICRLARPESYVWGEAYAALSKYKLREDSGTIIIDELQIVEAGHYIEDILIEMLSKCELSQDAWLRVYEQLKRANVRTLALQKLHPLPATN